MAGVFHSHSLCLGSVSSGVGRASSGFGTCVMSLEPAVWDL